MRRAGSASRSRDGGERMRPLIVSLVMAMAVGIAAMVGCTERPAPKRAAPREPAAAPAGPAKEADATATASGRDVWASTGAVEEEPVDAPLVKAEVIAEVIAATTVETGDIPLIDKAQRNGGWDFGNGPEFPGAKGSLVTDSSVKPRYRPALKLTGDFSGGGNYVQMGRNLPDINSEAVSFWLKAPNATTLTLRLIDGTKQCHQIKLKLKKTEAWQKIHLPIKEFFKRMGTSSSLEIVSRYERWGGAADGRWHDPAKGVYVLLGRHMFAEGTSGSVWLAGAKIAPKTGTTAEMQKTVRLDEIVQEGEVDWSFSLGQEFKGAKGSLDLVKNEIDGDTNVLAINADFTSGGAYVAAEKSLTGLGASDITQIRLRMKSRNTKYYTLRMGDATGQCHQTKGNPVKTDGEWHEVVIVPEKVAGGEHWGGKNDGKWHGPAQYISIIVPKGSSSDSKPVLLIGDISAEAVVQATVKPAAYREGFEAAGLPAGWSSNGAVKSSQTGAFKGAKSLALSRTLERRNDDTSARGSAFAATPGMWQLSGATKPDLHSPDNSYQGSVSIEALNAGGGVIEGASLAISTGKKNWQTFSKQVELPVGTARARFVVKLAKTYGTFMVDELAAAHVAQEGAGEKKVDRILLATGVTGAMYLPDEKVVVHVSVEATKPLSKEERDLTYSVRDYWGAEYTAVRTVALERKGRKGGRFIYTTDLDFTGASLEVGKYFELHVSVPRPGGDPYEEYTGLARVPLAPSKKYSADEIPFTIRNWDSRVPAYFYLADRIGIRSFGVWGGWSNKPPYKPHLPGLDLVRKFGGKWVSGLPGSAIERNGFKDWTEEGLRKGMRNFLEEYWDGSAQMLCLGNEPHGHGKKVLDNVRGYKALYEAAKAYNPDVVVVATSVNHSEEYFEAGYHNYCDAYDFHVYETYSDIRRAIRMTKALMNKYNAPKPIHCTELGLNSQGMTRYTVANELVKKITCFFAEGGAIVSWFTMQYPDSKGKARGTSGDAHCVFDCKFNNYNARLDAIAYYTMVNGVCIKKCVDEVQHDNGVQDFLFRDANGDCMQVLWKEGDAVDVGVTVGNVPSATVVRIDGSRGRLKPDGGVVSIRVSAEPLLLLYNKSTGKLERDFVAARVSLAAKPRPILKGGSQILKLQGEALRADRLRAAVPPRWKATFAQAGPGRVVCTVTAPEMTAARHGRVHVELAGAHGKASAELTVSLEITSPIAVTLVPVPARGDQLPQVELRIRNNGSDSRRVRWDIAIAEELTMAKGSYDLNAWQPASAYLAGTAEGQLTLTGKQEKRYRIAVADLQPTNIYRAQARAVDQQGRAIVYERLIGGFAGAVRARTPVKVDGVLDDAAWKKAAPGVISDERQYYVLGNRAAKDDWSGPEDLSAEVRFAWDDTSLYLGVVVTDDVHRILGNDASLWNQDGLQLLVDPARTTSEKPGKYDLTVGESTNGAKAWVHLSAHADSPNGEAKDARVVVKRDEAAHTTTYEVAFPWKRISPFRPVAGANLGLTLIVNEDDGEGRRGFMGWFSGAHSKQLDMNGDVALMEE